MTARAPLRTGIWFQGGFGVPTAMALARQAEEAGIESVWVAEGPAARDAFITLSAIATVTRNVELGTGVVNPFTRHPAQLAASFATLDELAGGRVVCGVGIGARDFLTPLGVDVTKPLTAAREMLDILGRLLAREVVDMDGVKFRLDAVRLGLRPPRERMPIVLAATGPKMCGLAGSAADGIYLMYGTRPYIERSLTLAGEHRTDPEPLIVASPILMAVDDDINAARASLKPGIGLMLTEPNGEGLLETNGLDPSLAQRIRDALAEGGVKALYTAVDNSIVDAMTIVGSRAQCVDRMHEAVEWGINQPQLLLTGSDPAPLFDVLTELRRERGVISLEQRVAVVTGAGSGLGRAYAHALADHGAKVLVNDLGAALDGSGADASAADRVASEIVAAGGEAIADHNTVASPDGGEAIIQHALDVFGQVDILVNNAGNMRLSSFAKLDVRTIGQVLDVHLGGTFYVTKPAWMAMSERKYGRIIFTGSGLGAFGIYGAGVYAAAKGGIAGLLNVLELESERHGIRVNGVAPMATTRMGENLYPEVPATSTGPDLVAPVIVYLASDACAVNGEMWSVGGGSVARLFLARAAGYFKHPVREGAVTADDVASHLEEILRVEEFTEPRDWPSEWQTVVRLHERGETP